MSGEILVAKSTALVWVDGRQATVAAGRTTVRAGHPILEQYGDLFEPLRVDYELEPESEKPAEPDAKTVREWAVANGITVPARGKLPADVIEQYQAAQA